MLSLEVMGPGAASQRLLAGRKRRRRHTAATRRWRRSLFGWGAAGGVTAGCTGSDGDGVKISTYIVIANRLVFIVILIRLYSAFVYNSARKIGLFPKLCVVFLYQLLLLLIVSPFKSFCIFSIPPPSPQNSLESVVLSACGAESAVCNMIRM
jgi:hypothetical protein